MPVLKYVMGGSVGGLLSVALTSPQSPKLLLLPLEPNQSPPLCQWRPRLILRTTVSVVEAGGAGVLDALQKQLLRGGALSHPPPLQSNSSRRKLAPSPADTKVINRNLYPKAQLDQPGSPWPLSPHVCVCLEKHVNAAVGRGGPPLDLRVERSHHVLFHSSPVPERRP